MLQVVFDKEKTTFQFFLGGQCKVDDNSESCEFDLNKPDTSKTLVFWMIDSTASFIELDDAMCKLKSATSDFYSTIISELRGLRFCDSYRNGWYNKMVKAGPLKKGIIESYLYPKEEYHPERLCMVYQDKLLQKAFQNLKIEKVVNVGLVSKQFYSIVFKVSEQHEMQTLNNDILSEVLVYYLDREINSAISHASLPHRSPNNYGKNPDLVWKLFIEWNKLECAIKENERAYKWKKRCLPKMIENSTYDLQSKATGYFNDKNIQMYFKAFAIDMLKLSIKCAFAVALSTVLPIPMLCLWNAQNVIASLCLVIAGSLVNAVLQYAIATADIELKQTSILGCSVYYPSISSAVLLNLDGDGGVIGGLYFSNLITFSGLFGVLTPFLVVCTDLLVNISAAQKVDYELSSRNNVTRSNVAQTPISFALGCAKSAACLMLSLYGIKHVSAPVINHLFP